MENITNESINMLAVAILSEAAQASARGDIDSILFLLSPDAELWLTVAGLEQRTTINFIRRRCRLSQSVKRKISIWQ